MKLNIFIRIEISFMSILIFKKTSDHFASKKKEVSVLEQLKYTALQTKAVSTEVDLEQINQRLWHVIKQLPERCQEL